MQHFEESIYRLIEETSTNLPADVRRAIKQAQEREDAGTRAALSLSTIADNIEMAECNVSPICQDTGMPTFYYSLPGRGEPDCDEEANPKRDCTARQRMASFVRTR